MKASSLIVLMMLIAQILAGCSKDRSVLMVQGEAALLANPYPLNYPSSSPKPNKTIKTLRNEKVTMLDEHIDKDFLVYKVRTADGTEGYLLAGPGVIEEQGSENQ